MSSRDVLVNIGRRLDHIIENINGRSLFHYKNNTSESLANFDVEETPCGSNYILAENEKPLHIQPALYDDDTDCENNTAYLSESEDLSYDTENEVVNACISQTSKPEIRKYFKAKICLGFYPPDRNVKLVLASNFSRKGFVGFSDQTFINYLEQPLLSASNCHHIFKVLIEMEDLTTMTSYVGLAQVDRVLNTTTNRGQYWIAVQNTPNIDEVLKPFMDEVVIIPKTSAMTSTVAKNDTDLLLPHADECTEELERKRYIATVDQVSKDRVFFRFKRKEDIGLSILICKYDIIFRPRRLPLRYQHRALELLAEDCKMRNFLFPKISQNFKQLPNVSVQLFNQDIGANPEQLQTVCHILSGSTTDAPYVIFGPPGTGKTTTIVETIIQLRLHQPGSRILVTAGSNSACDTIALRICKYLNSSLEKQPICKASQLIRIFSKSVEQKGLQLIDETLLKYSNCRSGQHYYPAVEEIRKYDIIISTLSTVGKLVTGEIGACDFFTHIFIDEAGASTEPETLVGIIGTKSEHCQLILCGDHKQLGPVLKCERAAELGLKVSMMERLLNSSSYAIDANGNYNSSLQTRLCRNYRSHPAIVGLYNQLYYNNELVANADYDATHLASKWRILPNLEFPIIFQAVHGKFGKEEGSSSSWNQLEIKVLLWYLQRLLVDGIDGSPVQQEDIGIITPYKLQVKRIQSHLNHRCWHNVNVGSVETFQGREKPITIVSLVRSFSGLGFVKNPQRLNVLLSRAKSLLLLLGNPVTLRRSKDLNFIIEECKKNKTYLHKKKQFPHLLLKAKEYLLSTQTLQPKEQKCIASSDQVPENMNCIKHTLTPRFMQSEKRDHDSHIITTNCESTYKEIKTATEKHFTKPEENGSVTKKLRNLSVLLSIPQTLLRTNLGEHTFPTIDHGSTPTVQRYSKVELFKYGNKEFSWDTNNNEEICRNLKTLQQCAELRENQENNNIFLNTSNLNVISSISQRPKPFRSVYNLRSYAKYTNTQQTRSELLQKIVRPCRKCTQSYLPAMPMPKHKDLRYSKDDLLGFL